MLDQMYAIEMVGSSDTLRTRATGRKNPLRIRERAPQ